MPTPSIAVHGSFLPVNSDRCGIRGDRLCSPHATTSATSLARCGFATAPLPAVTNYLRVSISACLTDTSGEPAVSVRSNSNATRNLRLLFRLVNAGSLRSKLQSPRSHTVSHVPPTHRGSCRLHSTPSALTPPQAPMGGAPMHFLHSGNDGDRCAHFEQPPAHGTEGSANSQTASGF